MPQFKSGQRVSPALNRPTCVLVKTALQTITNNVVTDVTWDSAMNSEANGDPYGMHTAGSASVTIPTAGRYLIQANLTWVTNGTGVRQVRLLKNGTTIAVFNSNAVASFPTYGELSKGSYLAVGDVIKVQAYQNSGVDLNLNTTEEPSCMITMLD